MLSTPCALGFKFQTGDVVLLTDIEHNSNLVPWLKLHKAGLIKVDYVASNQEGVSTLQAFEQKLKNGRVRLVSMAYTSNSTGYTNPGQRNNQTSPINMALESCSMAPRPYRTRTIDVRELDVDFLAFSIHKMCGPRGVGDALWQKGAPGTQPERRRRVRQCH